MRSRGGASGKRRPLTGMDSAPFPARPHCHSSGFPGSPKRSSWRARSVWRWARRRNPQRSRRALFLSRVVMAMHRSAGLGTCRAAGEPHLAGEHPKTIKMCCVMPNTSRHPKCPRWRGRGPRLGEAVRRRGAMPPHPRASPSIPNGALRSLSGVWGHPN